MLGSLLREQQVQKYNISTSQETRDTKSFPHGNHKGENPATSSEIESTPK